MRGFSEALITDFRVNAPHLRVSVVMPGHIGTSIVINSGKVHGRDPESMDRDELAKDPRSCSARGALPVERLSDDDLRKGVQMMGEAFRDAAPTTAAQAATIILDGVRQNRWRILVGDDAETRRRGPGRPGARVRPRVLGGAACQGRLHQHRAAGRFAPTADVAHRAATRLPVQGRGVAKIHCWPPQSAAM